MGLTRKSKFGLMPSVAASSTGTVRMVPLTQGVRGDMPWTELPPGSAISMTNFLPINGNLVPRSRLSSLNTINVPGNQVLGLQELTQSVTQAPILWYSGATVHGVITSNGSVSRASFVSSFGLGVTGIQSKVQWQYAPIYSATLDANMLMATGRAVTGSSDTILVLYNGVSSAPIYSYLTSAPKAACVASFDNYAIAFNVGATFGTRVQWSQRGNASNWTGEGSGFEDLLQMRGIGMAAKGAADGRLILWSDQEIWYGVSATYPAQWQFAPLDTTVGCPFAATIAETDLGFVFVGSDLRLRLLPKGGGLSQVVAPSLNPIIVDGIDAENSGTVKATWGVYDSRTRIYYLYLARDILGTFLGIALHIDTGEWGYVNHPALGALSPRCGTGISRGFVRYLNNEGVAFGTSTGTICSTSRKLTTELGSVVTGTWRSAPIGAELPGNYKQIVQADCDYRATSRATVTLKVSQDGGNSYGYTAMPLSLLSAPVTGRATSHLYAGGGFPCIELTSTDTGFELHRLDVTINTGGQR
jgi:hypothetical protein